jgi:transcriptional regulator with XRE-family HTH domain
MISVNGWQIDVRMHDKSGALRAIRKGAGLTQTDLAVACGVSQPDVSLWEHGKMPLTIENLAAISKCVDCGLPELLGIRGLRWDTLQTQ